MTYTSQEKCAADATKKYQVVLDAVCAEKEGKALHTKIGNCKELIHVSSPSACSVFDYGAHLGKILAYLQKFVGVILIVLGAVFLWKGYLVFSGLKWILVGTVVWCACFGIAYNLFPADKLDLTTLLIMLGVTLLIAGIAAYFLVKVVDALIFPLLCGYLGAVILVLVCGLLKQDSNHKILVICAIVGFIGGGVYGYQNKAQKHAVIAYGTSFIGAYLFVLGVAAYAGGFNATPWSIYAYFAFVVIAGGVRGHF